MGCFLVHPAHRRRGITSVLLARAEARARASGAGTFEAFPRASSEPLAAEEPWTGVATSLERAGD